MKEILKLILSVTIIIGGFWWISEIAKRHDALLDERIKEKQEELEYITKYRNNNELYINISFDPIIGLTYSFIVQQPFLINSSRYRPVVEETDDTPLQTADLSEISMIKLQRGKLKWVAVSRDLLVKYGYGSKIKIQTGDPDIDGVYEVHDTMNPRWTSRVDILTHPKESIGKGKWDGKISKL